MVRGVCCFPVSRMDSDAAFSAARRPFTDGFVYMLGRADDIINVGGEKASPIEIENTASLCPGIRECACIGVEDVGGVLGEVPVCL